MSLKAEIQTFAALDAARYDQYWNRNRLISFWPVQICRRLVTSGDLMNTYMYFFFLKILYSEKLWKQGPRKPPIHRRRKCIHNAYDFVSLILYLQYYRKKYVEVYIFYYFVSLEQNVPFPKLIVGVFPTGRKPIYKYL